MGNPESLFEDDVKKTPIYKFSKMVDRGDGTKVEKAFVSVVGIELEVNTEGPGSQFTEAEFAHFSVDNKALELLKIYAKAIKLGQPALVEAVTDIGKSKALEYLAFLTNNFLIYQSFSGDTDVSELIGKYVPNTEDAQRTFEKILNRKNRSNLKAETQRILRRIDESETKVALTQEECQKIAELEDLNFGDMQWVWQDGTVPRAMEHTNGRGCWLYFDEMGAAESRILVKLNRIFGDGLKRIEITEDGGREVIGGDNFHLLATTNPPAYSGRAPFAPDYLRRWVYQKVSRLTSAEKLDRANYRGHKKAPVIDEKKLDRVQLAERPINLSEHPAIDELMNLVIVNFADLAAKNIAKLSPDRDAQQFSFEDFTDIARCQDYLRALQGKDLIDTLRDAVTFIYINKLDASKEDISGKNARQELIKIFDEYIVQAQIMEKLNEELEKIKTPEEEEATVHVNGRMETLSERMERLRGDAK